MAILNGEVATLDKKGEQYKLQLQSDMRDVISTYHQGQNTILLTPIWFWQVIYSSFFDSRVAK